MPLHEVKKADGTTTILTEAEYEQHLQNRRAVGLIQRLPPVGYAIYVVVSLGLLGWAYYEYDFFGVAIVFMAGTSILGAIGKLFE